MVAGVNGDHTQTPQLLKMTSHGSARTDRGELRGRMDVCSSASEFARFTLAARVSRVPLDLCLYLYGLVSGRLVVAKKISEIVCIAV